MPAAAPRRALLKVGYRCNNDCVFCHAAPHRGTEATPRDLRRKVREAAELGARTLVLSGGEPTIHPRFSELIDCITAAGMRPGLVSNGRMLCYGSLVVRLLTAGLEYVHVTISGPDAELHDRHARAPAFRQTWQAIAALAGRVPALTINVVVTRWNVDRLLEIARLAAPLPATRLKFSFVEPAGNALDDFDGIVPALSVAAGGILAAVATARRLRPGWEVIWDGLPLCLARGAEDLQCGLREDGFAFLSEAFEREWHPIDDRHRAFGAPCLECSLRRRCRGVFREYLEHRGADELRPVVRPVPNSFLWIPSGPAEPLSRRQCPVRAGRKPPPDPVRGIFVEAGAGRVRRYEAATHDFSDETVGAATRVHELVYAVRGSATVVSDFPRQLRRLRLARPCRSCPRRPLCGGLFRPAPAPPFRRAQALLSRILRRLTGNVLDVGCGLAPYAADLAPAARAGKLHYVGLDPRRTPAPPGPGFTFIRGTLARLRRRGPCFDAVLSLRSINHLADARRALEKIVALTAPGGTVLLAEDVVFGTLHPRGRLPDGRARRKAPFEHYRSWDVDEAAAVARTVGLTEIARLTPRETESTLWILVLQKKAGVTRSRANRVNRASRANRATRANRVNRANRANRVNRANRASSG